MNVSEEITTLEGSKINKRRMFFGLSVAANHTLICVFYFASDNMRLDLNSFLLMLGILWTGNVLIAAAFLSGKTSSLKDPALTVPLMLWIGLGIIVSAYYLKGFRLSMLMLLFGIMLLGAFRVQFRSFFFVTFAAVLGYGAVLFFVISNFSENIDATVEVIELLMFTLVTIGMLVTVTRIAALQKKLSQQSKRLNKALDRVNQLAIRDELTGMLNRRRALELLREQHALAESGDYSYVIAYIDLDHFKSVNDTYGHGVGDEVIKRFAVVCEGAIRNVDFSGRMGGEEFVVVFTNTKLPEALSVAERLRESFQEQGFDSMPDRVVTLSIGVAQFVDGESLESMMHRADENLYTSKESGRNRITHSKEDIPAEFA